MTDVLAHAQALADLVPDYHAGQIPRIDGDRVMQWAAQFDEGVRLPIIAETTHVLRSTYLSRAKALDFLSTVVTSPKLNGGNALQFWTNANILDVQLEGNSQSEMRDLIGGTLREQLGIELDGTGQGTDTFVYLDDGLFTGNRVRRDLEAWLATAPQSADLHIIVFVLHRLGQFYVKRQLTQAIQKSGKAINVVWWRMVEYEDRKKYTESSDVLRPIALPDDPLVNAYVANMQHKPHLRPAGSVGQANLFSSDAARQLIESEFLKAGVRIRAGSPNLGDSQRPLGHMSLETLGFGSMFVTFRNCPNNAPLALWAGDPWIPLFPRITNREARVARLFGRGSPPWG